MMVGLWDATERGHLFVDFIGSFTDHWAQGLVGKEGRSLQTNLPASDSASECALPP